MPLNQQHQQMPLNQAQFPNQHIGDDPNYSKNGQGNSDSSFMGNQQPIFGSPNQSQIPGMTSSGQGKKLKRMRSIG
jgi:hypothetical protein